MREPIDPEFLGKGQEKGSRRTTRRISQEPPLFIRCHGESKSRKIVTETRETRGQTGRSPEFRDLLLAPALLLVGTDRLLLGNGDYFSAVPLTRSCRLRWILFYSG